MIQFIKRNKYLSFLIIITLIVLLLGLLIPSILSKEDKRIVEENIINLNNNISNNHIIENKQSILISSLYLILVWFLGISVIGIPIILLIYLFKVFLLGIETVFILINLDKINLLRGLLYIIPNSISILIYFFLIYYALSFSFFLIKLLFLKKQVNIKINMKQYIKVLIIVILINLMNECLKVYILPSILKNIL